MKRLTLLAVLFTACGGSSGGPAGDDASSPDSASPLDAGACPDGTTPGTMNGIAVCKSPSGVPRFDHVFVIVMENTSYETLVAAANTPYIHSLLDGAAAASDYHGVEHPSLPNYIAMESGDIDDTGALDCDCQPTGDACGNLNCNFLSSGCGCPQAHDQLVDQLEAANISWRGYAEDMGTPCNVVAAGKYAPKHVPFLYFTSLVSDTARCNDHVVDYESFATDLAGSPRRFNFLTPNLDDDMHDPVPAGNQNYINGDTWLAAQVPPILATSAFMDHGLVVIVWDEDDLSGVINADDPIPMILISPLMKADGYLSTTTANHYSLLATIEDGFGVPRLGNAASAAPLTDFFPDN
jgi:hypothetical protein